MSDVDNKVKMIVEGLLLAAGRPLSLDNISQVFSEDERPDRAELKSVMTAIAEGCDDRGFELAEVASGYRFQVKQELGEWISKLWEEKPPRYTRALLETLALIAYRQPITRGDIEEIRGVTVSSNIIRTLLDREWIRVVGHRDVPGRPAMFATTRQFLDYFNLKSLQDLPPLSEIKALESSEPQYDLAEGLASQRVIDLPDEAEMAEEELSEEEKAELLAEEEAIELSKKPLDEILNLGAADDDAADDRDDDDEPRSLAQVIPIKPDMKTGMQGVGDDEEDAEGPAADPVPDLDTPAAADMSETFVLEDEDAPGPDFTDADDG
ncbi:MAG: SMC-Scp complex subunit ScpB, partial [Pseudohongiellaceae bacterium]